MVHHRKMRLISLANFGKCKTKRVLLNSLDLGDMLRIKGLQCESGKGAQACQKLT